MTFCDVTSSRRSFLKTTTALATGISGLTLLPSLAWSAEDGVNIIGPKAGYSPQIGTMVSELTWMRLTVLESVKGMSQKDLDYLFDSNANTIGALLLLDWEQDSISTPEEIIERFHKVFGRDMIEEERRSLLLTEPLNEDSATL